MFHVKHFKIQTKEKNKNRNKDRNQSNNKIKNSENNQKILDKKYSFSINVYEILKLTSNFY